MTRRPEVVDLREPLLPMEVAPVGDDLVVVRVHGEIDLSEAGELRAVLNDACSGQHATVVVDLSEVHFIGSSGMGVLVELHHRMAEADRRLVVTDASAAIQAAFDIAGVSFVFEG